MTPCTSTRAILFCESLSSTIDSSNLGPAARVGAVLPRNSRRAKCNGLKTSVMTSRHPRIIAVTRQPRPRLGGRAGARRGGDNNGGGVGVSGGVDGGKFVSIAGRTLAQARARGKCREGGP